MIAESHEAAKVSQDFRENSDYVNFVEKAGRDVGSRTGYRTKRVQNGEGGVVDLG